MIFWFIEQRADTEVALCWHKINIDNSKKSPFVFLQSGHNYHIDLWNGNDMVGKFQTLIIFLQSGNMMVSKLLYTTNLICFKPLSYLYSQEIAHILDYEKNISKFQIT